MIDSINDYRLDSNVDFYDDLLVPFGRDGYKWARMFGKQPLFKGEKYYWMIKNDFLGRECSEAMISAIHNKISKISIRYYDTETKGSTAIRLKVNDYLIKIMGNHSEMIEIDDEHKVFIWQTDNGNIVLDLDFLDTELILTSSSIRNQKKKSIFCRFFGD